MIGKIGILAGGVGELGVLRSLQATYPMLNFVYWGDTARYPLSAKSEDAMLDSLQQGLDFMEEQGVESVILASADLALAWVLAYEEEAREAGATDEGIAEGMLEILFEPTGGDYHFCVLNPLPSFGVSLWATSKRKKIGILAGETFINSAVLPEIVLSLDEGDCSIYAKEAGLLAALTDNDWHKRPEASAIVKKHVKPLKDRHVDVLAVTDANSDLLLPLLDKKSGKACEVALFSYAVLDTAEAFIEAHKLPEKQKGSAEINLTDYTENVLKTAKRFYGTKIKPVSG